MNKPLFGLLLGAVLGAFDGLTALVSAPELRPEILGIVIGSTIKGIIAGVLIGWFAKRFDSLPLGLAFGGTVGLLLALAVAAMPASNGQHYYWEIMLPGAAVGLIVGYATQKYQPARRHGLAG